MEFDALRIDAASVDADLQDAGTVGPELAHLAGVYQRSPRALAWRAPSPEWRLFVLLPPLASRLSLMANPIFAQLTRAWGLNVRFVGVDRDGLAYDFRNLLSDRTLRLLVELLGAELDEAPALDALFGALAGEMLTVLERRGPGWGRHLDVEHRLEPLLPATLFARESRYPDFLALLRCGLRDEVFDLHLYGRALRSIDERELEVEQRIATLIESCLDPDTLALLQRTGAGAHLGGYNWLHLGARHRAARAHVLGRVPGLVTFLAETLVPVDAEALGSADPQDDDPATDVGARAVRPTLDLRSVAARSTSLHSARCADVLRRAIDAGQDRAVIEALAQRFAVGDNLIRRLWREMPTALGQPPTWHLRQILQRLHALGERHWPANDAQWQDLMARAVPMEAH